MKHSSNPAMLRQTCLALLGAGVLASAASSARANLIANGSFESPVVAAGTYNAYAIGDSSIAAWEIVGPAGSNVAVTSGTFAQAGFSFPAQDGAQWLDLTGTIDTPTPTGVQQLVTTTPGATYDLTFYVGNVGNPGGLFGATSTIDVFADDAKILSATNSNGTTVQEWLQFSTSFVASGSTTSLRFINADSSAITDTENGLDNVVLTERVPEPLPFPLLASGLILAIATRLHLGKLQRPARQR